MRRHNPLAFLAAIFSVTALAWTLGYATPPDQLVSAPDFSSAFLKLDIRGALQARAAARRSSRSCSPISSIRCRRSSASRSGGPHRSRRPSDQPAPRPDRRRGRDAERPAWRARRPGTAYVESIAGHSHGRAHRPRLGGDGALLRAVLLPRRRWRPRSRLRDRRRCSILVGVSMFQSVVDDRLLVARGRAAGVRHVVLIPLTLSITQGILWGFLLHALLYAVAGRAREVSLTLWLLSALSAGLLLLGHLGAISRMPLPYTFMRCVLGLRVPPASRGAVLTRALHGAVVLVTSGR